MTALNYINPVFYDKKVQELNGKLNALGWISKLYPLAWMGEETQGTFPEVYVNDGSVKNIRVMPEGNSISFFQIEGDLTEVEEFHFQATLSLTVWADLTKVNVTKKYDYTAELIAEVVNVLRDNSCNDLVISTDQVMAEFSYLQKLLNQNTMRPYTAFKITFTCLIALCCAENEPYNPVYEDWFLPSNNELTLMYLNLYSEGVGNLTGGVYWSSSEVDDSSVRARVFNTGIFYLATKQEELLVRPIRSFMDYREFPLRTIGQAGLIFNIVDNLNGTYTYYEVAPSDHAVVVVWSNIQNATAGAADIAVGTGKSNTTKIINQTGHVNSAAKICNDLIL